MSRRHLPFLLISMISLYALFSPASGVPFLPPGVDKVGHCAMFATMAWTGQLAGFRRSWLAAGLIGYAIVSEILQSTLPINRDGDAWDAAVDLLGIIIGRWLATRRPGAAT